MKDIADCGEKEHYGSNALLAVNQDKFGVTGDVIGIGFIEYNVAKIVNFARASRFKKIIKELFAMLRAPRIVALIDWDCESFVNANYKI